LRYFIFTPNFSSNNYGIAYDPRKRIGRVYDANKLSKDQYGQNYDISEQNLAGFKDWLKRTKKSRYADERGMTYKQLATRNETTPNPSDAMWERTTKQISEISTR
jgi:hypothetical protein